MTKYWLHRITGGDNAIELILPSKNSKDGFLFSCAAETAVLAVF